MANVWSRALCSLLVSAPVVGTALACSERDAATNPDPRPIESTPAARASPPSSTATRGETTARAATSGAERDAGAATPVDPPAASGDFHLDGADVEYDAARRDPRPRKSRPIELILRSTPPGAIAAIDGVAVGPTPTVWQGATDGRAREFTFVLPGYSIARYRFIPMQNGIVHGTLGRLKSEPDAGPAPSP